MTVPLASVLWDSFLLGYGLTFLQPPEDSALKTALLSDFRAHDVVTKNGKFHHHLVTKCQSLSIG